MKSKITVNKTDVIDEIDKRIYGSFVEHLGRCVYGGIYEPTHKTADKNGFRQDVLDFVKQIDVPIVRYPGGNFVSGYNWEDGTGDRAKRPQKKDYAWKSIETNEIGIDEFQQWARLANTTIDMAVNLGTRGAEDAKNLVEYCNSDADTHYADLRRQNGFEKPFAIKTWCLGNEMDGDWQIGHKTAEEYGRLANEAAVAMKSVDPNIELVVCGSSNYDMDTFGSWDRTVLEHTYDNVDYISMHQYYGNQKNNAADYLARSVHLDAFIKSSAAICDEIKEKKASNKTLNLALDEWNVWYHSHNAKIEDWQIAPPLLEDIYNFEDALLVGCVLMTIQNHCDRVKIACLAQLVNVIAPIMTENGGDVWAQTIFYPYMYASRFGRGVALKQKAQCESYTTTDGFVTSFLESSVILNENDRELVLFAVNRSLDENLEVSLCFDGFDDVQQIEHIELYCDNLKEKNTKDSQNVKPVSKEIKSNEQVTLKKHSWNMIRFRY